MTYETCKKADCTGCTVCPGGIAQAIRSDDPSTRVVNQTGVPEGVKGWCWGGFLMSWIWAIGNRTWIGLLSAIPYVGLAVAIWLGITDRAPAWIGLLGVTPFVGLGVTIWLGIKGRELAWKNGKWKSVKHFNRVQRAWTILGIVIHLLPVAGLIACVVYADALIDWFMRWCFAIIGLLAGASHP